MTLLERWYRTMLLLYPAQYRGEYGDLMTQTFRDLCHEARSHKGGMLRLFFRTLLDIGSSASAEHLERMRTMQRKWIILSFIILVGVVLTGIINLNADEVLPPLLVILVFTVALGFAEPKRAWLWALIFGLTIPISYFIALAINYPAKDVPHFPIQAVIAVVPALITSYIGAAARWMLNGTKATHA